MRASFFAAALCAAACGGSTGPNQMITNVQQNSTPKGSIAGRVLDAATGQPVVAANVKAYTDAMMPVVALTDSSGHYTLGPLPGGSDFTVYVSATGYVNRILSAGIDSAAGNYPIGDTVTTLDVDMSKGDATISGLVITSTTQIAAGASVFADLRPLGYDLVVTTKTDMAGKFQIPAVPGTAAGLNVTVSVAPFDQNGDGLPDFAGTTQAFRMYPGFTTTGTITLSSVGVTLVESNISDGDLAPTDPITLTFGTAIATSASTISLRSNNSGYVIGTTLMWDSTNTQLTVTPVGGMLVNAQSYTLQYTVRATSGAQSSGNISFVVRPTSATPPAMPVQNLRVTSPAMMKYDYSTSNVSLAWDVLTDAGGYHVYAKDTATDPAYLLLYTIANGATTTQNVNLSTAYFGSSNGVLSFGNHVTLAVVATDKSGNEAPLTMAATVDLSDNTIPTVSFPSESGGSANNSGGATSHMITYSITFAEPMLASVNPQLALNNAAVTFTFAWQSSTVGVYTLTVPAAQDGSGATMISGAKDTSGNVMMPYSGILN